MTLHVLLPLAACLLNLSLAAIALCRNPRSRLNRLFAYFVLAMAVWNAGVFLLRRAPDAEAARLWELVIHLGVIGIPVFYYHFVLIFLGTTARHRPSLGLVYALGAFFALSNLTSDLFIPGVRRTAWGWAPEAGPLYLPFLAYLYAFMIAGLAHLARAYRASASSFWRNRATLILLGTGVSLAGGVVDFLRFVVARLLPEADRLYPVGIPANMVFALMLGTSIVRYRLFDVAVAVRKAAVYAGVAVVVTSLLVALTRGVERAFGLGEIGTLWAVVPMGIVVALLLSPLGRPLEDRIDRLMFSRRRGCYETLLALSKRMTGILDSERLVETLVQGLVRGVPLARCGLLVYDRAAEAFVPVRQESPAEAGPPLGPIRADSPLVEWLRRTGEILVTDEVKLNPRMAQHFELVEGELEELRAALVVPLTGETGLFGILVVGEKLSGEIFGGAELEVLSLLANQAAVALENARLYEAQGRLLEELRAALRAVEESQQRVIQVERLRALGEMAAGVAHDFNNVLAAIVLRTQVLLERVEDPDLRRQLQVVETAARDGAQTVRRIQEFTRMRRARPFEPVDLNQVVDEVIEVTRSRWKDEAQARGIGYELERVTAPLPPIVGDPSELREALTNLVLNALDAMPQGGRLGFRTGRDGGRVFCRVSDTGVGMSEEVRRRIFDPFFTTKGEKGTGLGLSVVYGIVTRHGGEVEVRSEPGRGSQFTVWLPAGGEAAPALAAPAVPAAARRGRILVIDDETKVREVLGELLTRQGHAVVACPDGPSGLARFEAEPFDLVITDLGMPGLSGWDVARAVKLRSAATPVALVTGWGDQIDPAEARARGVDFVVAKPLEIRDLTAVVARALELVGSARG